MLMTTVTKLPLISPSQYSLFLYTCGLSPSEKTAALPFHYPLMRHSIQTQPFGVPFLSRALVGPVLDEPFTTISAQDAWGQRLPLYFGVCWTPLKHRGALPDTAEHWGHSYHGSTFRVRGCSKVDFNSAGAPQYLKHLTTGFRCHPVL